MTIEEKVQAVLAANSGVTALVPTARISVDSEIQGRVRPYIVHFPASTETMETHDGGLATLKFWRYQVSCFGDTYASAKAVAVAVQSALGSYRSGNIVSHFLQMFPGPYEPNVRVNHMICEFRIADMLT